MIRLRSAFAAAALTALLGCTPDYSPNTYSGSAVQQANKVEPGVVVGFREVAISANGTVGAVAGGAAGGILGAQVGPGGLETALAGIGGTTVGSLVGSAVEHVSGDTTGWEYIVRKPNGDLVSVTQREQAPLPIGQRVLVITGSQARVIADYSQSPAAAATDQSGSPLPAPPLPATSAKPLAPLTNDPLVPGATLAVPPVTPSVAPPAP